MGFLQDEDINQATGVLSMQGVGGVQISNFRCLQVQKNITRTPMHCTDHTLHCSNILSPRCSLKGSKLEWGPSKKEGRCLTKALCFAPFFPPFGRKISIIFSETVSSRAKRCQDIPAQKQE